MIARILFTTAPAAALAATLTLSAAAFDARAQWPQYGGPQRNFEVGDAGLADSWPEGGPPRLWHRPLGDGYSTIVVDGDRVYTQYRKDGREYAVCLDAATGSTVWEHGDEVGVTDLMREYGEGPHSTPLIVDDRLYTVGVGGLLHCFDKRSGRVVWRHDLVADFGMKVPGRGYSASPLAVGSNVVLPVGGKPGQAVMAFDQATGAVRWKNQDFDVSHASPILIEFAGRPQVVVFMQKELAAVDPADGSLLWRQDHPTRWGANLTTPTWNGKDMLVCSAAYDSGTRCIKLVEKDGKTVPQELWFTKKMKIHHGTVILEHDHVYASSGDFGPAFFMCADIRSGRLAWRKRGFAKATCVYAGGKLIILDQDGSLALATVDPGGMTVHARCTVAEPYAWAAPTLVGTRLYIRDRKHIMAFELG